MPKIIYVTIGSQLKVEQTPIQISNVGAWVTQEVSPWPCDVDYMAISKGAILEG